MVDVFDEIGVGMALVRPDGRFERVNEQLCRHLGYSAERLERLRFQDITLGADLEEDLIGFEAVLAGRRAGYSLDKRYIRGSGQPTWARLAVRAQRDSRGRLERLISTVIDIDEAKRREEELRALAMHDGLTSVLTRRAFEQKAKQMLHKALRRGWRVRLWMADVDGLKALNDGAGHAAGDAVLREVGRRLRSISGKEAYVGRLGGDEFAIITRGELGSRFAKTFCTRVAEAMKVRCVCLGQAYRASMSIGAAEFPRDGVTLESLLRVADRRMYRQKRALR